MGFIHWCIVDYMVQEWMHNILVYLNIRYNTRFVYNPVLYSRLDRNPKSLISGRYRHVLVRKSILENVSEKIYPNI